MSGSGLELIKCGGRCGQATCAAHFVSKEDLSQHIKMSRLLQCRHVRQHCVVCVLNMSEGVFMEVYVSQGMSHVCTHIVSAYM